VNLTGTPWLGTAGAGDVLAGLCGALAASTGADLVRVGAVAAWLHGSAAVRASAGGPISASDVARAVPGVLARALGAGTG
jgi:NAD(P)H-hydrate repair Nnr-like enzyme with NAD(P)H-hydrate dehydratase domain